MIYGNIYIFVLHCIYANIFEIVVTIEVNIESIEILKSFLENRSKWLRGLGNVLYRKNLIICENEPINVYINRIVEDY